MYKFSRNWCRTQKKPYSGHKVAEKKISHWKKQRKRRYNVIRGRRNSDQGHDEDVRSLYRNTETGGGMGVKALLNC